MSYCLCLCSRVLHHAAMCDAALPRTVPHFAAQCYSAPHGVLRCRAAPYCTVYKSTLPALHMLSSVRVKGPFVECSAKSLLELEEHLKELLEYQASSASILKCTNQKSCSSSPTSGLLIQLSYMLCNLRTGPGILVSVRPSGHTRTSQESSRQL